MNATIIPTPYDIVAPPPGPIIPSVSAWGALALLLLVVFTVRWFAARRHKSPSLQGLVADLLDELRRLSSNPESGTSLERITRLTRRILSMYIPQGTDSLSSTELRSLAATLSQSSMEQARSSASIVDLLASLEDLAYAPQQSPASQRELISQIEQLIDQLVRRYPLQ
jgi:hypothetical protein